jgi:hypothetical protein
VQAAELPRDVGEGEHNDLYAGFCADITNSNSSFLEFRFRKSSTVTS